MNLKPMNKDIIIRPIPEREMSDSIIYYTDDPDAKKSQYFEVLRTSDQVTLVKEGDTVMVDWRNVTPPFVHEIDGVDQDIAITDESKLEAIVYE